MGLIQNETNRMLLGISKGKVTHKLQDGTVETFGAIEGRLKSITRRNAVVKEQNVEFLDFLIEDNGQEFALSCQTSGGVTRGIILCLASIPSFVGNRIKINPYLSKDGEHTNIAVSNLGQKVSWVTTAIPRVEEKQFGSQVVKDDTKRLAFINSYIELVQQRLVAAQATPQAAAQEASEGDMPGDDAGDWMKEGNENM